jgi:hypothetical protein
VGLVAFGIQNTAWKLITNHQVYKWNLYLIRKIHVLNYLKTRLSLNRVRLVARGAVDIGVNDKVVTHRRLAQHFALLTRFELTSAVKELYPNTTFEAKKDEVDGRSYFLVYEWLAKAVCDVTICICF